MTVHGFERRYAEADSDPVRQRVTEILVSDMGAVRVERASRDDDLRGVDFWAYLTGGNHVGVEVKNRRRDHRLGDILVEIVSQQFEGRPGWAVNPTYITDFLLYLLPGRHFLIPYATLRATVLRRLDDYRRWYGAKVAESESVAGGHWTTENIPVPEGRLILDVLGIPVVGVALTPPQLCPGCKEWHSVGTYCWQEHP